MKAVYVTEYGGPQQFSYGDLPEPDIRPQEVLIRVRATAVNRRDAFAREGSHGLRPAFPFVPGREVAGEIEAVGGVVTKFKPGDRVVGVVDRSYADYCTGVESTLEIMPPRLTFEEAAAIPVSFSTAWHMLVCCAHLSLGEEALIMAGGSGVGSAGIQIAKRAGARVLTTASTDEKLGKAKALGADEGINYQREDFAQRVKELTGGQGVDLVLEHIGTPVWEGCFASLKRGGRLVICGVTAGHRVELHLGQLWTRDLTLIGTGMRPQEDLAHILRLVSRGELRGVVSQVLPLREASEAHRLLEASDFFGKIVLVP